MWTISTPSGTTRAILDAVPHAPASGRGAPSGGAVFVCGHGAGGHMDDERQRAICQAVRDRGVSVVRFNFLYSDKGGKRPDRMPKCIECFAAVVAHVRAQLAPTTLILGGRSMGGRVATMMAADGFACDGLVLYAYPLHPAGEVEKLRDEHLANIRVPVLCFNGTRDELCTPSIMKRVLKRVAKAQAADARATWTQAWLDDADHSFHVTRASGTSDAAVLAHVADASVAFVRAVEAR